MTALQKMGEILVEQSPERVDRLALPDTLADAIRDARRIRDHEGRRRQMQYIGRLMRDVDDAPIREAIDAWDGTSRAEAAALHATESWRERLLDDDAALTRFAAEHTAALNPATLQRLRTAIRAARTERDQRGGPGDDQRPTRHYRVLFRIVRDVMTGADVPSAELAS